MACFLESRFECTLLLFLFRLWVTFCFALYKDGSLLTELLLQESYSWLVGIRMGQERREDADPQTMVHYQQSRFHLVCERKTSNLKSH